MVEPLNALLLEDSQSDALLLLRELRHGGFEVDYILVDTADEMKAALHDRKWDIILSDYSMPSFDALAALKIVREQGLDVPFIIVSGTVGEDAAVLAMKAGASDFFAKGTLVRLVPSVERELREAAGRRKRGEAEARFTTAFHSSPIATVISRLSDGQVLDVNARFLEIYGLSRDGAISKTASELELSVKPEDRQHVAQQLGTTGSARSVEVEYRHISGRLGYALLSAEIIELDNELCVLSMIHDITDRKEAEQALKRYVERLGLLHEIDQAILMADQPQAIAQAVLTRLQASIRFESASVTTFDPDYREFTLLASIAPISFYPHNDEMSSIELLQQNEIHLIDDLSVAEQLSSGEQALLRAGYHSYVRIPLIASGKLLGAFSLRAVEPKSFSKSEVDIAREVAAQLAIAIENARLLEIEQRRNSELTALHQASLQLTSSLNVENVLDTIVDYAILLVRGNDAHIFLYDGETLTFGAAQWQGEKRDRPYIEPDPGGLIYTVAQSGQRRVVFDVHQHPGLEALPWGAIIGLPLRIGDRVLGVMSLTYNQPHQFDEPETRVLELLADQAAIAIHNAQLYQQIRHHSEDLEQRVLERTTALQTSEAKYRALIEFAPDPIVIVDEAGDITLANKRAEESFGYWQDELIGQTIEILLPGRWRDLHIAHRRTYIAEPSSRAMGANLDLMARHKNGTEIPVKIGLSPIRTDTETLIMAYIIDITEDKQLEASLRAALANEKELNELKTSFTSIVSHEFRTPLSVILSSTDLLTKYSDRMDQNRRLEKLENITRQVRRLIKLLDDVLTITRSESTGFEFKPTTLDLVALSQEILEEVRVSYRQDITLDFNFQDDCRIVNADEFLFSHILQNLASNAIKYSPNGGTVHILLTCSSSFLTLRVEDQGIGIPEEHQSKLFQAFHRADNVGQIKGTGIGLTIVKRAVDAYRGTIEFESVEGQGTIFMIHLPTTTREDEAVANET